jgi:DNA-binding transcriptional MerR regulator
MARARRVYDEEERLRSRRWLDFVLSREGMTLEVVAKLIKANVLRLEMIEQVSIPYAQYERLRMLYRKEKFKEKRGK